jgi:choice-of-anchor A domain-containing protein
LLLIVTQGARTACPQFGGQVANPELSNGRWYHGDESQCDSTGPGGICVAVLLPNEISTDMKNPFARGRHTCAGLAAAFLVAAALVAAPALSLSGATTADAAGVCPASYPNLNNKAFTGSDSEVTTYVGGNFTAETGAAESEGVMVVAGSATFDQFFNLGVAGVGSRVPAPAGSDMLTAGGSVTVAGGATLDVGSSIGGNVVAGGTISGTITTNGGTTTAGATTPLNAYSAFPANIATASAADTAAATTGTVASTGFSVTFTGDGTTNPQYFSIAGSALGSLGSSKTIDFESIPLGTPIVVNVTGAAATFSTNSFVIDGNVVDPNSTTNTRFEQLTQSLLWNIPTATTVTLGYADQLLGSVLVPTAASTTTQLTSTNGRIYVAGNFVMGGSTQSGLEMHSYPNDAAFPCDASTTAPASTGDLEMVKVLNDSFNAADPARVYTGTFACTDGVTDVTPTPDTWSTTAGAAPLTLATGLPVGTTCTISEDALVAPPKAGSPQYLWASPAVSGPVTISSTVVAELTVTNTVLDPDAAGGGITRLPITGVSAVPIMLAGGGSILAGVAALLMVWVRRRRARTAL